MTFDASNLCKKYQNGNLDVHASQWYYLFLYKSAERCLNLNPKTSKWNKFAEFLKLV
jgi:hypothetical protein